MFNLEETLTERALISLSDLVPLLLLFIFGFDPLPLDPNPTCSRPKLDVSRVSKSSLFRLFQELCRRGGRPDLLALPSYAQAKMAAEPFQRAKGLFFQALGQHGYGAWIGKPLEEKSFEGNDSAINNSVTDGSVSAYANAACEPYSVAYPQSQ